MLGIKNTDFSQTIFILEKRQGRLCSKHTIAIGGILVADEFWVFPEPVHNKGK
jgi:hypothetical protein